MVNQNQPQSYKDQLQEKIVDTMIHAVETEQINEDTMSEIAAYVLDHMDPVTDKNTAVPFLQELAARWNIFTNLYHLEQGEILEQKEDAVTQDVLALLENGKIDNAIELAKSVTHTSHTQ